MFVVTCAAAQVAVDGAHTLEYKHRVALQRVDTITISGKISVSAVGVLPGPVSLHEPSLLVYV